MLSGLLNWTIQACICSVFMRIHCIAAHIMLQYCIAFVSCRCLPSASRAVPRRPLLYDLCSCQLCRPLFWTDIRFRLLLISSDTNYWDLTGLAGHDLLYAVCLEVACLCLNNVSLRSQTTIKTAVLYASIGIPTDTCLPFGPTCLVLELVTGDNSLSASGTTLQHNMQRL